MHSSSFRQIKPRSVIIKSTNSHLGRHFLTSINHDGVSGRAEMWAERWTTDTQLINKSLDRLTGVRRNKISCRFTAALRRDGFEHTTLQGLFSSASTFCSFVTTVKRSGSFFLLPSVAHSCLYFRFISFIWGERLAPEKLHMKERQSRSSWAL